MILSFYNESTDKQKPTDISFNSANTQRCTIKADTKIIVQQITKKLQKFKNLTILSLNNISNLKKLKEGCY